VRVDGTVTTAEELRAQWPDLRHRAVVGLDLRTVDLDWSAAQVEGTVLLGCALPAAAVSAFVAGGAGVVDGFTQLPFTPYRAGLYTYDELVAIDARLASWFAHSANDTFESVARAVHDATIDAAVARFVAGRRVVGIMGGHAIARDDALYHDVARLGRALTRAGYCVATGGGPGVMEAANCGAWFSAFDDDQLDLALAVLASAPSYRDDATAYVERALEVRARWSDGTESLGVPTWVYLDEPTTAFATHIAKYFTNSIRENGLLAIARSGVVYTPGGPGTAQEIFTDAAQNSLTLYDVRSPMVFFAAHLEREPDRDLVAALRFQAASYGWGDLVAVCATVDDVVEFLQPRVPHDTATATIDRRRMHRRGAR
jgi:predicted Rossmann-fold nucleotide-binding protein